MVCHIQLNGCYRQTPLITKVTALATVPTYQFLECCTQVICLLSGYTCAKAQLHCCYRQKTIDEKTYCPCYNSTKRIIGGKGRGFWCGSCLFIRMGENIHEVKHRRDWRCPCCRDICNCSGANCLRARRNLAVTNQLIHEATKQGFKSVSLQRISTELIRLLRALHVKCNQACSCL